MKKVTVLIKCFALEQSVKIKGLLYTPGVNDNSFIKIIAELINELETAPATDTGKK